MQGIPGNTFLACRGHPGFKNPKIRSFHRHLSHIDLLVDLGHRLIETSRDVEHPVSTHVTLPPAQPPPQFANPVRCVPLGRDRLVCVRDCTNNRLRMFR